MGEWFSVSWSCFTIILLGHCKTITLFLILISIAVYHDSIAFLSCPGETRDRHFYLLYKDISVYK